jgi:hypothetical protein
MPNLKILQDQPDKLKNQIYGFDGTSVRPLLTDTTGRTDIRPLSSITDSVGVTATDLDVRDLSNTTDNILVYGNDGTTNQVIKTNTSGQIDIRPLTVLDTVSVTATDLDIRPLNSSTDSVVAVVTVNHFEDSPAEVTTSNAYEGTTAQEVTTWRTFSFFIENTSAGANSATVKIQISPDNVRWIDDGAEETLDQNAMTVLVTSRYLRYARVAYKSTTADSPSYLSIIFQAQG